MGYEKLDAWKACHGLVLAVFQVTGQKSGHAQVIDGLRRYAVSAAALLAFGSGTRNRKMFMASVQHTAGCLSAFSYFLSMARLTSILADEDCIRLDALRGRASFYAWRLLESQILGPARDTDDTATS